MVELTTEQRAKIETSSTLFLSKDLIPTQPRAARQAPVVGAGSIALYIDDADEPLLVRMSRQTILGRYSSQGSAQPQIDLTPYGAFDKGISRMHAILKKSKNGLEIEDLASANGTWLNTKRLQPYMATPLRSGDHIRIGQIEIEIHFDTSALDPATTGPFHAALP
jgi:pSer/pThr/pTyr-binding forkhead associated (FHA) protein